MFDSAGGGLKSLMRWPGASPYARVPLKYTLDIWLFWNSSTILGSSTGMLSAAHP